MKKKLLLFTSLVVMFICAFAIVSGAKTVTYRDSSSTGDVLFTATLDDNSIITDYSGAFPKTDSNNNALTWYVSETLNADTENVTKIVKSFVTVDSNYCTIGSNGMYKFITSTGVTKQTVVSINFPNDMNIKSFSDGSHYGFYAQQGSYKPENTELLFAYFPNTWTETERIVQATTVLEVYFDENNQITVFKDVGFYSCKSLRKVVLPKTVKEIQGGNGLFFECSSLVDVNLKDTALEKIGNRCFYGCKSLTEITFPNSLIYAEERLFQECSNLQTIRLGNSFQYFTNTGSDHQSFTYLCPSLKYVYIPASFYKNTDIAYKLTYAFNGGSNVKFFFTGTEQEIEDVIDKFNNTTDYSVTEGNSKFLSASLVSAEVYLANPANYENGNYIVYGYSACDAFYNGVHTDTDKDCTTKDICTRCGDVSCDAHEATVVITYKDYTQKGTKSVSCTYDNCNGKGTEEVEAIFTPDGYSVREDGKALLGGYSINTDALKAYNAYLEANGKAILKFGIIMSNASNFTIVDGEYKGGKGLIVESTNDNYSTVKYTISGYKAENALVNLELVITLYVIDENGMSFIQADSSATLGNTDNATCNGSTVTLDKISLASVSQATLNSGKVEAGSSYETALKEIVALIPTEAASVNKEN